MTNINDNENGGGCEQTTLGSNCLPLTLVALETEDGPSVPSSVVTPSIFDGKKISVVAAEDAFLSMHAKLGHVSHHGQTNATCWDYRSTCFGDC